MERSLGGAFEGAPTGRPQRRTLFNESIPVCRGTIVSQKKIHRVGRGPQTAPFEANSKVRPRLGGGAQCPLTRFEQPYSGCEPKWELEARRHASS